MSQGDGFIARWSRRKAQAQAQGLEARTQADAAEPAPAEMPRDAAPPPAPTSAPTSAPRSAPRSESPSEPPPTPPPTLDDVAALTPQSDYARYVAADVAPEVRNAALKRLFADPRYNVMDGLDSTFEDYTRSDPLPPGMLREMAQSQLLGLFDADAARASAAPPPTPAPTPPNLARPDENADLQLQPDDDAGRAGAAPRAGSDGQP